MGFAPQLHDFIGEWRVERRICDRFSGVEGRFSGRAVFARADAGLSYHEAGELHLGPGPTLGATRDYFWHSAAGRIIVDHADGRPFHSFDPALARAAHWCDPDQYRGRYCFFRWPLWRLTWSVRGPRKDYTMQTDFQRAEQFGR